MTFIRFASDQYDLPVFAVTDPTYTALGSWITGDISVHFRVCLDALADVDDLAKGRPVEPWGSEHYDVAIDANGIRFSNRFVDESGSYSLRDLTEALEEYWRFLASQPEDPDLVRQYWPDLPRWQAELLLWEQRRERQHPYRGRLF
ncbi:hypothetical protein [Asanoa iriomotensis]|uniref:SUKH-4 immunity protein of toxin-antitoxin system n=1 Tax=Asanoa iriomotensis TaxID=234613 RepID=A0ABQ4BW32_9ACTN|nr:hypothetical protein [Asanoa iriomotensis]GIF54748.1 hypothetical protein Air01nite_08430 [Asanoa iriomotensis]